jgi:hypothetical protein
MIKFALEKLIETHSDLSGVNIFEVTAAISLKRNLDLKPARMNWWQFFDLFLGYVVICDCGSKVPVC